MDWAKDHPEAITREVLSTKAGQESWGVDATTVNRQLHVALVSLCKDEALTVVRNSVQSSGLDAWRRLVKEYEPNTPQANLRLLRKILQPPQQILSNLRPAIENWEKDLTKYRDRTQEDLSDSIK
eukprot:1038970-Amphidinium_carterae.1